MKLILALPLLLDLVLGNLQSACARQAQSPQQRTDMDLARSAKAREMQLQGSDAVVHAQYAADAPKREAQRQWNDSHRRWRVLVFQAVHAGDLSLCENAHHRPDFNRLALPDPAAPLKSRWLVEAASIQWRGGNFTQRAGEEATVGLRRLTDMCFTLFVEGAPVMSGAVVPEYSARRVDFPALVIESVPSGKPLKLTLAARFPDGPATPVPVSWGDLLKGLSRAE